ncbi:MAG: nucleotidyltransferase family protein [Proteobacteria bacterium]|nr:nucleotidyltransferase family protein [Pseudomonadota bacterium]
MKNTLVFRDGVTFEDAIRLLDENGNGFLPVVDDRRVLLGILTDGDIRRAILNKKTDLLAIINRSPATFAADAPRRQAIQFLKSIHRRHLPLVDTEGHLADVLVLDDIDFNAKPNRVVIMAGGFGRRLGDLTREIPKPMLRVGKKSMLENLIDICSEHGFNRFYISVHYKAHVIQEHFGDGQAFGVQIEYLEEEVPLGTAGSLSLIPEKPAEPILVINGDILTAVNFEELLDFHTAMGADGTMCVRKYDVQIPYGVVQTSGRDIVALAEKPVHSCHVNSGIYVLEPAMLDLVPKRQFFNMTSLFEEMISQGRKAISFELVDYWVDVGRPVDFDRATRDLTRA